MTVLQPFTPSPVSVASGSNVTIDGSSVSTNKVLVTSMGAKFDAEVFIDAYDGATWQETRQLAASDGSTTLTADWDTQANRILCVANERRLRIENVDTASGQFSAEGDVLE
jgi:hypothetical protein